MISSKAASAHQGGVALLWRESEDQGFLVEAAHIASPNILTFQLVTGEDRFFVIGAYTPPADTTWVDDLHAAWAKCPPNCKPLLLGDLNFNFRALQTKREEIIADFIDNINLVDVSRKYIQQGGQRQGRGAQWTWRQRRGGHWHQSQPDHCMARESDVRHFCNVAFWQPRIHNLDHRAIVTFIRKGKVGKLKRYRKSCQTFPLQLPPAEEQDAQTRVFGELRATCKDDVLTRCKRSNWISEESWRLIAHRAMLRRTGRLCQTGGRRMQRQIGALLCKDHADRTERVGTLIESKLTGGNVQEAFRHLKGWYRATSEMQAKPCFHTVERQTSERVDLFTRRLLLGDPLPINVERTKINNDVPSDGKIRTAVSELSNGRVAGAFKMRAEHAKEWLWGIGQEDDPERLGGGPSDWDHWRLFIQLVQAGLDSRQDPLPAPLDDRRPYSEGRGGLLWHQAVGTHLEGD